MASNNRKQTGLSRRDFIKSAAAVAGGTVLLGGAAAATAAEVTVLENTPGPIGKATSVCDGSHDLALINGKFLPLRPSPAVSRSGSRTETIRKGGLMVHVL